MIKVGEVMEAIDGVLDLSNVCILGLDRCDDEACCALHETWTAFRQQFAATASQLSLKEAAATLTEKGRTHSLV
jgi:DNA-binding IscR family transcriptional regulator